VNEASRLPSIAPAVMPEPYASAVAMTPTTPIGTHHGTTFPSTVTSAVDAVNGTSPVSPRRPSSTAATSRPAAARATGGRSSVSHAAIAK
jgi:hypothetical protein